MLKILQARLQQYMNQELPDVQAGFRSSHEEYLADLTYKGLKKRFEVTPPTGSEDDYMKRAEYELSVINSMGYTDYYLIVWDFINYAKTHEVTVGPGRGSGAVPWSLMRSE